MRVLITGITSFLGRAISNEMLKRGIEVYGIVRETSKNAKDLDKRINIIYADLDNIEKLDIDKIGNIDVLIHLAWDGIGSKGRMDKQVQARNILNTLKIVELVSKLGCKRILFSGSQAEYGLTYEKAKHLKDLEENESYKCSPISEYGKAKLEVYEKVSKLCESFSMEYVHLRIFSVYGGGDHQTSLVSMCIRAIIEKKKIVLSECKQLWNYIYIDDCARAISDLAVCKLFENALIVNVAGKDTKPLREFAFSIQAALCKTNEEFIFFEKKEVSSEGTPYLNPNIDRLRELTNFKERVSFEEGVKKIEKLYSM